MCLSFVSKVFKTNKDEVEGYKIFLVCGEELSTLYMQFSKKLKKRKWIKDDKCYNIEVYDAEEIGSIEKYKTGFHIFKEYQDAEAYMAEHGLDFTMYVSKNIGMCGYHGYQILRVKGRNITAEGNSFSLAYDDNTVVARELYIF